MSVEIKNCVAFERLEKNYLFSEVRAKKEAFKAKFGGEFIDLGIGDVAYPLPQIIVEALVAASREMGDNARFRGYPAETGYPFLKEAIAAEYNIRGVDISVDEIFISDGAKSDAASITDILEPAPTLIPDPVYPVYADSAVLRKSPVTLLKGSEENAFLPLATDVNKMPYIIWLCSPNNPTGATYTREGLKAWVEFAHSSGSLILFDAAYSAFAPENYPKSIFEIDGAKECAVEICSFSKSCGFTGLRCSFTVIPASLKVGGVRLKDLWKRRQSAKFNGVSYIIQRAAQAALSPEGKRECGKIVAKYVANSRVLGDLLKCFTFVASNSPSPYVWFRVPDGFTSWGFFDYLLDEARVVGTPGSGFGRAGEGYFRLSCFAKEETAQEAAERIKNLPVWN